MQRGIGENAAPGDQIKRTQGTRAFAMPNSHQLSQQKRLRHQRRQPMDMRGKCAALAGHGNHRREQIARQSQNLNHYIRFRCFPLDNQDNSGAQHDDNQQQQRREQRPPDLRVEECRYAVNHTQPERSTEDRLDSSTRPVPLDKMALP